MSSPFPVAVTGIGCLCAPGNTLSECLESLFKGERNPAPPLRFTTSHSGSFPVFEVSDDLASLNPKGVSDISRTARLALKAAMEAVGNAGLDREALRSKRVGGMSGYNRGQCHEL